MELFLFARFHTAFSHTLLFVARVEQLIDHPLAVSLTRALP